MCIYKNCIFLFKILGLATDSATSQNSPEADVSVSKCDGLVLDKVCDEPDEPPSNPWSGVKCIFCLQTLNSTYEPKLLECLHAACSACINNKLQEQEQTDGDVIGDFKRVIIFYCQKFSLQPFNKRFFKHTAESTIECPTCNVICNSQNIIDNQFLLETDSEIESGQSEAPVKPQDVKCSSCSDNASATSWCVECAEFICDSCVQVPFTFGFLIKHLDEEFPIICKTF